MINTGWTKLHRSLLDWEWYDDHNATRLLIHLICAVNYEDKKWKGITIKSGSMVLSWNTLSIASYMTVSQCRTAMQKLIECGEVTKEVTNRFQVISLVKWEQLQSNDSNDSKQNSKQDSRQIADKSQTNRRQIATTKESKEYKESKEVKNISVGDLSKSKKDFDPSVFTHMWNNDFNWQVPKIQKITDKRKKMLLSRIKDYDKKTVLNVLKKVESSRFLNGENNRSFVASFDWIFNLTNFQKILEDNYQNREPQKINKPKSLSQRLDDALPDAKIEELKQQEELNYLKTLK